MAELKDQSREELIKTIEEKDRTLREYKDKLNWYREQIELFKKKMFGSKSEKSVAIGQTSLFDEIEVESTPIKTEPALEEVAYKRKRGKKHNRNIDLSDLPTKTVIHDLKDKTCPVCGLQLRKTGENVRKELIYHPARFEVVEHIQYVYTCDKCEKTELKSPFYKAELPESVIYKSFASPSLLSGIIDNKFNRQLPLYRQEMMYEQLGAKISRQTMSNWMIKLYNGYFKAVVDYMHGQLISSSYIHGDETTVQVLNVPGKEPTSRSYMWVYRTGRSEEKQLVIFQYETSRSQDNAKRHLKGYGGILQSDGYQAYKNLEGITHAGCYAHLRRKYKEALDSAPKGTDLSKTAAYRLFHKINALFEIERQIPKGTSYEDIRKIRDERSRPLVDDFFKDARECEKVAIKKTKLSQALTYSINQESILRTFLEDGRIEMTNNPAENSIRSFVVGKKNWLFMNTVNGAKASAAIYSIVETAKLNKLRIYDYFNYLLTVVTKIDIDDHQELEKLMPWSKELPENLYIRQKS